MSKPNQTRERIVSEEIGDLTEYLNGLPAELRDTDAFASYYARLKLLHLNHGLALLDELAKDEYDKSLRGVLSDRNYDSEKYPDLPYKRIGRLMAVWAKKPFSDSSPYEVWRKRNWAASNLTWKFRDPMDNTITEHNRNQSELLVCVASDWNRPVETLHEYNIFHWLCEKLQPVVCGDSKALEQADKVAQDLRNQGVDVSSLSSNSILAATSASVADFFVKSVPWLSPNHSVIVTGCTVLAVCMGKDKLCNFFREFRESEVTSLKLNPDGKPYPQCGSIQTKDGEPCPKRVLKHGSKCWIHGGIAIEPTDSNDAHT